jgi:hypothetical protein
MLKKIVLDLETQSTIAKATADCSMVFIITDELIGGSVC